MIELTGCLDFRVRRYAAVRRAVPGRNGQRPQFRIKEPERIARLCDPPVVRCNEHDRIAALPRQLGNQHHPLAFWRAVDVQGPADGQ